MKRLEEAARSVEGEKLLVSVDVSKADEVKGLFKKAVEKFGRVDISVANAGYGVFGEVAEFDEKNWDGILAVNLKGVFLCCKEAMKIMKKQKSGYILNVASTSGQEGYAEGGAYCASKFGVRGFSKALMQEAKEHDVRVSILSPGAIDTHFFDKLDWGGEKENMLKPEEVAECALFLVSRPQNVWIDELTIHHLYPVWKE